MIAVEMVSMMQDKLCGEEEVVEIIMEVEVEEDMPMVGDLGEKDGVLEVIKVVLKAMEYTAVFTLYFNVNFIG